MNRVKVLLTIALATAGSSAWAMNHTQMDMKQMDANGDGMISKVEFMKFHEQMFAKMKKNKSGMIDMKDMEMMHNDMQKMHGDKSKTMDAHPMTDKVAK